jgi:hypothetical protein
VRPFEVGAELAETGELEGKAGHHIIQVLHVAVLVVPLLRVAVSNNVALPRQLVVVVTLIHVHTIVTNMHITTVVLVELLVEVTATAKHKPTELLARLVARVQELVGRAVTEVLLPTQGPQVRQELTEITQMVVLVLVAERVVELSHSQVYQLTQSSVQTLEQLTERTHNDSFGKI